MGKMYSSLSYSFFFNISLKTSSLTLLMDLVPQSCRDLIANTHFQALNHSYSMKPGRVVILLAGRHAGKKAIIVR